MLSVPAPPNPGDRTGPDARSTDARFRSAGPARSQGGRSVTGGLSQSARLGADSSGSGPCGFDDG